MTRALPWIIVVLCGIVSMWAHLTDDSKEVLTNERSAATQRADSLQGVADQYMNMALEYLRRADSLQAVIDTLESITSQEVVDHRLKLNRWANAERIGRGLVKPIP